jgi:hypothetical protein
MGPGGRLRGWRPACDTSSLAGEDPLGGRFADWADTLVFAQELTRQRAVQQAETFRMKVVTTGAAREERCWDIVGS